MGPQSTAISRWDLTMSYSEFSVMANSLKLVGHLCLPPLFVSEQAGTFSKMTIGNLLKKPESTKRAPDGTYSRGDFEFTQDTWTTNEEGVEEPVDDRLILRYNSVIRAEMISRQRAVTRLLSSYERDVAATIFSTSIFTGARTNAVTTTWTNKSSSDPIKDTDLAKNVVAARIGKQPNTLILTDLALQAMIRSDRIESLLKYSGHDDPKILDAGLKTLLGFENIIVATGWKNTAIKGQTGSLGRFWDATQAMVCEINKNALDIEDKSPTLGFTIMWDKENAQLPGESAGIESTFIMEEYREEQRRGGVFRARHDRVLKILQADCGQRLTNVTS